jgi:thioester reductase-like protein
MNRKRTALLTGASGVIGRAVAKELRDHHVIGLAHHDTDIPEVDETQPGRLEAPRLGLNARDWAVLAERVEVIIHSGALTEWGQPWSCYQSVNIGGTREVVALAKRANAPIHLISTCFVHALERDGMHLVSPGNVVTPYIRSKLAGEKLVAHSGVPYSIYRPTNLVGDSRTGASSKPQIVQTMSSWLCRGKAPYFPAHPANLLDILSLDVTAITIARAVESDDLGRQYWLTTGPTAMTIDEAMDILVAHAADLGRQPPHLSIVDPSLPLPVPVAELPASVRPFIKVLLDISEITRACSGMLPTSLPELWDRHGVPAVSDRDAYRISLKYWAKQHRASWAAGPSAGGQGQ